MLAAGKLRFCDGPGEGDCRAAGYTTGTAVTRVESTPGGRLVNRISVALADDNQYNQTAILDFIDQPSYRKRKMAASDPSRSR